MKEGENMRIYPKITAQKNSEEMDKIETIADNSEYISLNAKHIIQLIKDGIDSGRI